MSAFLTVGKWEVCFKKKKKKVDEVNTKDEKLVYHPEFLGSLVKHVIFKIK